MFSIEISDRQTALAIDADQLRQAAEAVLGDAAVRDAVLSIAVVDDPTIHALNRQFLDHDEATDVLSFALDHEDGRLEGEVIASSDTALRAAHEYGWSPQAELLLYVIHGTLHLVGHDDRDDPSRAAMRQAERHYLALFGLEPRQPSPDTR